MAVALLGISGVARAQSGPEEAAAWCMGQDNASIERQINGCTWIIGSGRYAERNVSIAYNNRGNARSEQGDRAGALADYNQAIRIDPRNALPYNNRGKLRNDQGDVDSALADYNEAIRIDPRYVFAYNNRGNVRHAMNDPAGALADYNEAIRLDPRYAHAYNGRGNMRSDQGDRAGAMADYNEAIRVDLREAEAYNGRGNLRRAEGNLAAARADYDAALNINAREPTILANRCVNRFRQDDAGAMADCEAAIAFAAATNGWPHAARAGLHLLQGNPAAAETDLTEALRRAPRNPYARQLRAILRAKRGDAAGAAADTQAARAILARIEDIVIEAFGPAIAR